MPSWQWPQAGRNVGADQYDSWWAYHEPDRGNAAGGFSWAADAYELGWQYTPAPATSGYDDDSAWTGDLAGAAATASFNLAGPGATGGCNDGSTWWPHAQAGVSSNLLGDSGAAAGLLGSNLAAGPGAKAAGNDGSSWWPDAPAAGISNLAGDSGPTAAGLGSTLGPVPGGTAAGSGWWPSPSTGASSVAAETGNATSAETGNATSAETGNATSAGNAPVPEAAASERRVRFSGAELLEHMNAPEPPADLWQSLPPCKEGFGGLGRDEAGPEEVWRRWEGKWWLVKTFPGDGWQSWITVNDWCSKVCEDLENPAAAGRSGVVRYMLDALCSLAAACEEFDGQAAEEDSE